MKPNYKQPAVWLLKAVIIVFAIAAFFISCSVQYETTYQKNYKEVTQTTTVNRNIVGYEKGLILKNRIYYKVTDSEGKPAQRIYKPKDEPLRHIGGVFMLESEYKMQN